MKNDDFQHTENILSSSSSSSSSSLSSSSAAGGSSRIQRKRKYVTMGMGHTKSYIDRGNQSCSRSSDSSAAAAVILQESSSSSPSYHVMSKHHRLIASLRLLSAGLEYQHELGTNASTN